MEEILTAAGLEIRPSRHLALANGRVLRLSVREFELLTELARREGEVIRRDQLYFRVWKTRLRAEDRSVDVYVHKLRTKLAEALPEWRFIHTHFGFGYRFAAEPFTGFSQLDHNRATGYVQSDGSLARHTPTTEGFA